jgi:hypothetical protein
MHIRTMKLRPAIFMSFPSYLLGARRFSLSIVNLGFPGVPRYGKNVAIVDVPSAEATNVHP